MRAPAKQIVLVVGSSPSKESTLAALETAGCTVLSTQALLTAESQAETADGQRIRDLMQQNKLVPVATLLELLKRALDRAPAGPVLLPDFPRGVPQLAQLQTRCGEVALALQVQAELSERSVSAMVSKLPAERVRVVASADDAVAALKAAGLRLEPRRTMPPRHLVDAASSSFAAMIQRSAEIAASMREKAAGAMCAATSGGSHAQRRPSPDGRRPGSAAARPTASPPRAAMPPRPASAMPRAAAAAEARGCGSSQMLGPIVQMSDPPSRRRSRPSSSSGCRPAPAGCGGGGCGTSSEGSLAAAAMRTPGAVRPSSAQPRSAASSHSYGNSHGLGLGHGHAMSADVLTGISPGMSPGTSLYKLPRQRSPPRGERLQRTPLYSSVSAQRQALVSTLWSRPAAAASSASKPLRTRGGQAVQGRPSSAATRRVARGGGGSGGGGHRLRAPPQWDDSCPPPGATLWEMTPSTREWEHRQRVELLLQIKGPQLAFSTAATKPMLTAPNPRPWSSPPKAKPSQPRRRLEEEPSPPPPPPPAEPDDPSQVVRVRMRMHSGELDPETLKPRLISMQVAAK